MLHLLGAHLHLRLVPKSSAVSCQCQSSGSLRSFPSPWGMEQEAWAMGDTFSQPLQKCEPWAVTILWKDAAVELSPYPGSP